MDTNTWIKIPDDIAFKFNDDSQDYTLIWPDNKVILRIDDVDCKVENGVLSVRILAKPIIVEIDASIETTDRNEVKYPHCDGKIRCTGSGPNRWGLTICCETGYIVGECYGNWKCGE